MSARSKKGIEEVPGRNLSEVKSKAKKQEFFVKGLNKIKYKNLKIKN